MDRLRRTTNRRTSYVTLLALMPSVIVSASSAASADPIIGPATVLDGNTISVGGNRIGLRGIDAPDLNQSCYDANERNYRCGIVASTALESVIRTEDVICEKPETDGNGRLVMSCRAGSLDLSRWMVSRGHAVASRSGSTYADTERQAWGRRLGLWSGVFQEPNDWRAGKRTQSVAEVRPHQS